MIRSEQIHPEVSSAVLLAERLGDNRPARSEILQYRPEIYLNPDDETHGLLHTMNTVIAADTIFTLNALDQVVSTGDLEIYTPENRHILRQAAKYHDSHHTGYDLDLLHGEYAADWIIFNSTDPDKEQVAELVRAHVPDDTETMSELLKVLKDADGAERVRAPINSSWYLDMKYIRFKNTKDWVISALTQVNRIESRLLSDGFIGDGVDLAVAAFVISGWMKHE